MHQTLFDTSEILRLQGLEDVVLCPGSRNAPLIVSFARNDKIQRYSLIDERSAAFVGLGLAQAKNKAVAVCCTSGTALLNFGPAAAEAYYQEIPLILISADRPPEWIDQQDGQTIHQDGVLDAHVKKSYSLPVDLSHADAQWEFRRKLQEAVSHAQTSPQGPVHINVPIREPFYPSPGDKMAFSLSLFPREVITPEKGSVSEEDLKPLQKLWYSTAKKIIVIGQSWLTESTQKKIAELANREHIPVLSEIISNFPKSDANITKHDLFLGSGKDLSALEPELVLTIGGPVLSKNLKQFLRKSKITHWHLSDGSRTVDTFRQLTTTIDWIPEEFFGTIHLHESAIFNEESFLGKWQALDKQTAAILDRKSDEFSDLGAFQTVMANLPDKVEVHLANSMSVRYANFLGLPEELKAVNVFANRGTSGIDGTNSTVVGHCLATKRKSILLTGDLSFLYDRNAFLHNHGLENLRVIVFNNQSGGIFDLIRGPESLGVEEMNFIKTPHQRTCYPLASEFGFKYYQASSDAELQKSLEEFLVEDQMALLEIFTENEKNKAAFLNIKTAVANLPYS